MKYVLFVFLLITAYTSRAFTPIELRVAASNSGILSCANTTVTLSATSSISNTIFTWSGPQGFTASGSTAIVSQQGSYIVTAISTEGVSTGSYSVIQAASVNATPFWLADLNLPNGTTAVNTGDYRWTSSHTGVNTTKFSVLNNEFIVNNSKQSKEGTWSSAVIDIAGKSNVGISIDVRSAVVGNGSLENDTTSQGDYVKMYYVLNGGPEVLFCEKRGNVNDNSPAYTTISSELLTGSTLQVIIRSRASANDEYYYFDNIQLSALPQINVSAEASAGTTITCTNTQVQLSGSSNTPGVTFTWTGPGGFTSSLQNPVVNTAGTYTLQVTEPASGCTALANTTVMANTIPPGEISISNSGTINCITSSVTISGKSSSTGVNYKWTGPNGFNSSSSSATVARGGVYTLTATNPANGCTSAKSTTVAENTSAPSIVINNNSPLSCATPAVTLSVTTNALNASYLWLGDDLISDAPVAVTSAGGFYIITVTDLATGCSNTGFTDVTEDYSDCGARKATTAAATTNTVVTKLTHKAYPNPVTPNSVIEFTSPQNATATVSIYNALGVCEKVLFKGAVTANQANRVLIPATQLAAGAYYYTINTNGKLLTGKLLITK